MKPSGDISNPLLAEAAKVIRESVPQNQKEAYGKITEAGRKAVFSKQSYSVLMGKLPESKDPINDIAVGCVGLLVALYQQSGETMPIDPMVMAGMTLCIEGLDFIEQTMDIKIGNAELDRATELYLDTISPKVGITDEKLAELNDKVDGAMSEPGFIDKLGEAQNGAA